MILNVPSQAVSFLVVAGALAAFIRMLRGSFLLFSALSLPGTLAHELTHWLTGFFSNAQPTSLSIIPRRSGSSSYILGTVAFRNVSWYNGWIVGLSPLLLLPAAYFIAIRHAAIGWSALDAVLLYLASQLILSCVPSWQDLKIAIIYSWWFFLLAALAAWRWLAGSPVF